MNTIDYAEAVPDPKEPDSPRATGTTSFVEQLLSPVMLQRMMACGGGLLVLGFVGWLWSTGIFEQPLVAASVIGAANLVVLTIGIVLVRKSRYQLAGNGVTLLAALALPLNLWFYDAQNIITLADGGHLWIPAAICCAIYAFIARTLRNPMFVYTLVAGVVMTGLLFLADQTIGCFWRLLPPVSFLLTVGWMSFFAERLFPETPSDFSRKNFGFAFRLSGLVVISAGLIVLAGGQLSAGFNSLLPFIQLPRLATENGQKLWAIGLLLGTAAGFMADRFVGKANNTSLAAALGLLLWAGLSALDLLSIQLQLAHFGILFGVYLIAAWRIAPDAIDEDGTNRTPKRLGFELPFAAMAFFAFIQYNAQFLVGKNHIVFTDHGLLVAVHMLVTAAVAHIAWTKLSAVRPTAVVYLIASSLFATLASYSTAFHFGVESIDLIAACGLISPVAFLGAGLAFAKPKELPAWQQTAVSTLILSLLATLVVSIEIPVTNPNFTLFWTSAVATIVMLAAAYGRKAFFLPRVGVLTGAFSVSQLLSLTDVPTDYALVLSAMTVGLILVLLAAAWRNGFLKLATEHAARKSKLLEEPGNLLVFVGAISGVLLSLNRLLGQEANFALLAVIACQLAAVAMAGFLTKNQAWQMAFRAAGIGNVLAAVLVVNAVIETHWLQRTELGTLLFGCALLVIGHLGWYREGESQDEAATTSLWAGSLFVTVPLACGLIYYRSHHVDSIWNWWFFHEATAIVAAMLLLGAGMACRIRSTTICGVSLLTVYMLSLLTLIQWPGQLKSVAVLMMLGGGSFFLVAVLLSVYRDRLVSLPDDIREGRGMFRILKWR